VLRTYPRTKLSKFYVFQNTQMLKNKACLYSTCIQAVMYFVSNEICITVFPKLILEFVVFADYRSQWPRGLRHKSLAARLLRFWVRIPPGLGCLSVVSVMCLRRLCDGLITRPEESYRLWRVVVCDQEISKTRRPKPATGL
jgi:hypothetical protein